MSRLPKLFVCIGAQKAGTSWLFENLQLDTRFSRCPFVKEIHYFDGLYTNSPHLNNWRASFFLKLCQQNPDGLTDSLSNWLTNKNDSSHKTDITPLDKTLKILLDDLNDDWYSHLLNFQDNQCCALDITPDYAVIGDTGFQHMKTIADKLKILFVLRNPVDRAWSGLLQGQKKKPGGISEFLKENAQKTDMLFATCTGGQNIGARNNYLNTLTSLEKLGLTNKDNLLIKLYDDIASQPEQFIADIYAFLDMPCPPMTLFSETLRTRIYSSPETIMPAALKTRLQAHYKLMIEDINERFIQLPGSWMN